MSIDDAILQLEALRDRSQGAGLVLLGGRDAEALASVTSVIARIEGRNGIETHYSDGNLRITRTDVENIGPFADATQ